MRPPRPARVPLLAAVLVASLALSGCLRDVDFGLGPREVAPDQGWPSLGDAELRPGVRLYVPVSETASLQCTAGFLFRSPDNATLYLSFAAHCLGQGEGRAGVGADVFVQEPGGAFRAVGDVAFDGWAGGDDLRRDFALVAIRNAEGARDVTHPAVRTWGGPTGLADTAALVPGTEVIAYGASSQRALDSPDNVKTGRFVLRDDLPLALAEGKQMVVRLEPPSVQGDSGAGLMLADGRAAGILSQGGDLVLPGSDVSLFVPLDEMVELVGREDPSLRGLRLVTWSLR